MNELRQRLMLKYLTYRSHNRDTVGEVLDLFLTGIRDAGFVILEKDCFVELASCYDPIGTGGTRTDIPEGFDERIREIMESINEPH